MYIRYTQRIHLRIIFQYLHKLTMSKKKGKTQDQIERQGGVGIGK